MSSSTASRKNRLGLHCKLTVCSATQFKAVQKVECFCFARLLRLMVKMGMIECSDD